MKAALTLLAVLGATVYLAPTAHAQCLDPGTWTGTVAPPNSDAIPVTFEVKAQGDSLRIELSSPMGVRPFHDIRLKDGELRFWWEPGPRVDCVLKRQDDKSYTGDCVDRDGESGQVRMVPPKKSPEGA